MPFLDFHINISACNSMTNKNNLKQILVAYFTMEVGIESDIPTYAGGLGILAETRFGALQT